MIWSCPFKFYPNLAGVTAVGPQNWLVAPTNKRCMIGFYRSFYIGLDRGFYRDLIEVSIEVAIEASIVVYIGFERDLYRGF